MVAVGRTGCARVNLVGCTVKHRRSRRGPVLVDQFSAFPTVHASLDDPLPLFVHAGASMFLSRNFTLVPVQGPPSGAVWPWAFSFRAMPLGEVTPLARISSTTGVRFAALCLPLSLCFTRQPPCS